MTKLFVRAFAPFPEEVEHDQRLTEKMAMLQQFIRPEHLDIPPNFHESSWLVRCFTFWMSYSLILVLSYAFFLYPLIEFVDLQYCQLVRISGNIVLTGFFLDVD